jgi:hypothetical protein
MSTSVEKTNDAVALTTLFSLDFDGVDVVAVSESGGAVVDVRAEDQAAAAAAAAVGGVSNATVTVAANESRCTTCEAAIATGDRAHYKTPWHAYNASARAAGDGPVGSPSALLTFIGCVLCTLCT